MRVVFALFVFLFGFRSLKKSLSSHWLTAKLMDWRLHNIMTGNTVLQNSLEKSLKSLDDCRQKKQQSKLAGSGWRRGCVLLKDQGFCLSMTLQRRGQGKKCPDVSVLLTPDLLPVLLIGLAYHQGNSVLAIHKN